MTKLMIVSIASDHAGFQLKEIIVSHLKALKIEVIDNGPKNDESVDYPDYAKKVVDDLKGSNASKGILICGSGQGMAMSANKHAGIRAALCHNLEITKLARAHNDANILTLGARVIDERTAISCVDTFINTEFEGSRHITSCLLYTSPSPRD